jgi:hypothetical protein
MTLTELKTRVGKEFALLGDFSDTADDLIKDALTEFIQAVSPLISASLTIVSGVLEYAMPATIDLIERLEDSLGEEVPYTLNREEGTITLHASDEAETLTMYGVPAEPRVNAEGIVAGLKETFISALWQHIRATFYSSVNDSRADAEYIKAEKSDHKLLSYLNSSPGMTNQTLQIKDEAGDILGIDFPNMGEAAEY